MKNQNIMIDYLQYTTQSYNELVFQTYWNWCSTHGQTPLHTQQLLACSAVNKWFMKEWYKIEAEFVNTLGSLPMKLDIMEHLFNSLKAQIFSTYPKALIEAIKNDNIKNEVATIKKIPNYYAN
jgi:hypothetical protein